MSKREKTGAKPHPQPFKKNVERAIHTGVSPLQRCPLYIVVAAGVTLDITPNHATASMLFKSAAAGPVRLTRLNDGGTSTQLDFRRSA